MNIGSANQHKKCQEQQQGDTDTASDDHEGGDVETETVMYKLDTAD